MHLSSAIVQFSNRFTKLKSNTLNDWSGRTLELSYIPHSTSEESYMRVKLCIELTEKENHIAQLCIRLWEWEGPAESHMTFMNAFEDYCIGEKFNKQWKSNNKKRSPAAWSYFQIKHPVRLIKISKRNRKIECQIDCEYLVWFIEFFNDFPLIAV